MTIYKGSNQQVTVAYLPCCYDVEQVSNVKLNFYTTTGSSVEFSGETLNLSGYTATVVFQPAQLELLDDGTLRFIAEFDYSGSPVVKDSCTIYYLKTPASYVPINPLTEENFSASTAVTEYIDGTITEALVDYVDEAELADTLENYYTSAQTDEKIAAATKTTYNLDTMSIAERVDLFNLLSGQTAADVNLHYDFYTNSGRGDIETRLKVEVYGVGDGGVRFSGVVRNMIDRSRLWVFNSLLEPNGSLLNEPYNYSVAWNQIVTGGTKIATFTMNDTHTDVYAGNVSSTSVNTIWTGTQQQYDAITTKDPNTLYFING